MDISPPRASKADGFAAYFFEQIKIGDKIHVKLNPNKDHFLSRIAAGMEKNIAYWSGANGAESARCLIQYMEDTKDPEFNLTLFYSNPALYASEVQHNNTVNIIYYDWLINMAKKMENLKIVFTFTREKELLSVIILGSSLGMVGFSQILMERKKRLSQNITEIARTHSIQYAEVVVSSTESLGDQMERSTEGGE